MNIPRGSCCTVSSTRLVGRPKYNPNEMFAAGRYYCITILIGVARDIIYIVAPDHRSRCLRRFLDR